MVEYVPFTISLFQQQKGIIGNIYPNYDALQLLNGWEFYVFRSVGVNVCKKEQLMCLF